MNVKFQPAGDRVLILPKPAAAKTSGGLHIPDAAKAVSTMGRVIKAGTGGCLHCGKPYKGQMPERGMFVLYPEAAGMDIEIDGTTFRIVRASDIIGDDPSLFDEKCKPFEV